MRDYMARAIGFAFLVLGATCIFSVAAVAQGETTSAIVGQVRDTTNAVVPGATVTIANPETGLKRSAKTDDAGRFNFPQLKPGVYSVSVEAQGFEARKNNNVISGLGQKQVVDFTLDVARSNETVEVSSEAPRHQSRKCEHVHDTERADPGESAQSRRRSHLPFAVCRRCPHQHSGQWQRLRWQH